MWVAMAEHDLQTELDIGAGVHVRPWQPTDAAALTIHANDIGVARYLGDRFPHPYSIDDAHAYLSGTVVPLQHVLAIVIDGEACGSISAQRGVGERSHSAELGYWLGRAHWGQGHMTRIVAAFAPWAMQRLQLYRLQATVFHDNPASARVLQKNGFLEEGLLRNAVFRFGQISHLRLFSITRERLD